MPRQKQRIGFPSERLSKRFPQKSLLKKSYGLMVIASLAIMLSACQQEQRPETPEPAVPTVMVDSVWSADSVLIRYDVRGSGERALVFIHCWSCDQTYWEAQVEEFAEDYRVVTLDLAGHGESGAEREVWTMAAYGADVAAVVEKLALPEIILIGHSMGGTVMIEAARLLGDRVVALIGVDNLQDLKRELTEEQINGYLEYFAADFPTATYDYIMGLFPENADSALAERVSSHMAAAPEAIAVGSFDELFHYNYVTALREVRLPIRCINSDEFETNIVANNRVAASFAVKLMPGMGHFPHLVDPAGFNQLLHETIEEFWPREVKP
ncbi:alpha/beta fold hydrolase [Candidatus Zixiibacteriota bacterium]